MSGTYPLAKDVSPRERGNKTTLRSFRLSCLNTLHFERLKIIRGKADCQKMLECQKLFFYLYGTERVCMSPGKWIR